MSSDPGPHPDGLLTTAQLAARPDFKLGETVVSPSMRTVLGPAGTADVEPRVMQVLVVLADAANQVVTRQTLFDRCWGGTYVGDDSLNRAVAAVRRIAQDVAAGGFEIETVPRTGYRLTVKSGATRAGPGDGNEAAGEPMLSRRAAVGAGIAAMAVGAGGLGWWSTRTDERRRFEQLIQRGEDALEYGDPSAEPERYFRAAVAQRPDDHGARGYLAFSLALLADRGGKPGTVEETERATQAVLAADPRNPYGRLALVLLQRSIMDIATSEDQLRGILRDDPANVHALRQYWNLLQSAGRSRQALALVDRATAIKPLIASNHYPRAQLLWILGRNAEADRVIDRAMQYWPSHRFVRFARFTIFAFTDRARAAMAMLERPETAPQQYSPASVALWRISLRALDERSPVSIAAAQRASLDAAKKDLTLSSQAVMTLAALGEVDAAFEIADGLLQFRRQAARGIGLKASSTAWRFSPWLFTPPTGPLRSDPRFKALCDGIGLTEYWAKRSIAPDYLRGLS